MDAKLELEGAIVGVRSTLQGLDELYGGFVEEIGGRDLRYYAVRAIIERLCGQAAGALASFEALSGVLAEHRDEIYALYEDPGAE